MNRCECGSYAINIDTTRKVCDVCYYKIKMETAHELCQRLLADILVLGSEYTRALRNEYAEINDKHTPKTESSPKRKVGKNRRSDNDPDPEFTEGVKTR